MEIHLWTLLIRNFQGQHLGEGRGGKGLTKIFVMVYMFVSCF